jgi:hypothetical protein
VNRPDDDLKKLFEEARRESEGAAPPFRRVVERRPARSPVIPRPIRLALAGAAAVVVVVIGVRSFRRPPEIPLARIETWRAPTDFLLEPSFTDPFNTLPTLAAPVPDYSSLLAETKGRKS